MTLSTITRWLADARKALAAAAGVAALAIGSHVLHGTAEAVAETIVGLATVAGVYRVPGPKRPATPPAAP